MNSNHHNDHTDTRKNYSNQQHSSPAIRDNRFVPAKAATSELVLIRGIPGSGKSTMANVLVMIGYKQFEADMFFEIDGIYQYDASRIRDAHAWCQLMTRQALGRGENVVVSNTFTQIREMAPYLEMKAGSIRVIEAKGNWTNVHGVPPEAMDRMASRWEQFPTANAHRRN